MFENPNDRHAPAPWEEASSYQLIPLYALLPLKHKGGNGTVQRSLEHKLRPFGFFFCAFLKSLRDQVMSFFMQKKSFD